MSTPLLTVEHLLRHFEVKGRPFAARDAKIRAVDDISFEIEQGRIFSLVGESGCGKSTTARLVLRLIEPGDGRIVFDGEDITRLQGEPLRVLRRDMQLIFQDPYGSLNPRMRVKDIIAEPLKTHRIAHGAELKERVKELLVRVGLSPYYLDRYPHEFSGGQRQRVGIARAIALGPRFVVCDEPISALDVSIQAQILKLLKDLQTSGHLTYLFITHDLRVVRLISDRVGVMYLGKIVEVGSKEAIFADTLHPYTQALFSSIPSSDPKKKRKRLMLKGDLPSPISPPSGCRFHTRCPFATEVCRSVEPELREITKGHWSACHLHGS